MSATTDWTREAELAALRAASVDGVAPTARSWMGPSPDRPSRKRVEAVWGTWTAFVQAAGLTSALEHAATRRKAKRDAEFDRLMKAQREQSTKPKRERNLERWAREKREARRAQMAEDVASGSLVCRRATPEEMARFAAEREQRARRYEPRQAELAAVPGVIPPRASNLVRGDGPPESA